MIYNTHLHFLWNSFYLLMCFSAAFQKEHSHVQGHLAVRFTQLKWSSSLSAFAGSYRTKSTIMCLDWPKTNLKHLKKKLNTNTRFCEPVLIQYDKNVISMLSKISKTKVWHASYYMTLTVNYHLDQFQCSVQWFFSIEHYILYTE